MKLILKTILKYYLRFFARLSLLINKPIVIAIAGSTNKPFVKESIKKALLQDGYKVHANAKNFNTEIGLPLAILDLPSGYSSYRDWLPAIINAPKKIFSHQSTEILVLAYGTSDPGDMKNLLSIAKPNIAIITDLTQRYLEGFNSMNQLMQEYELLVNSLPNNGLALLNNDNPRLYKLALNTTKTKTTFSINESSDYQAVNIKKTHKGLKFSVVHNSVKSAELQIKRHGQHHIYATVITMIVKNYVKQKIKQAKRKAA